MTRISVRECTSTGDASAATALARNEKRTSWRLQNVGEEPLFYKKGTGCSTSDYTGILADETTAKLGEGGVVSESGDRVYNGIITIAGTTPAYVASEDLASNLTS
jgi:hypothetical protein